MKLLKTVCILLVVALLAACGGQKAKYISTEKAYEMAGAQLEGLSFLVYPECRENPIRWFDSIPEGKIEESLKLKTFEMNACPDEYFVYQLGFWAIRDDIPDIELEFSNLESAGGPKINSAQMTCFNKGGINFRGEPFSKEIPVKGGRVQALWLGIDLDGAEEGTYEGLVKVKAEDQEQEIPLKLKIEGDPVNNHGYNQGKRLSRLDWLNSKVGINEDVTKGYPKIEVENNEVKILGRTLIVNENGLPGQIFSSFGPSNQKLTDKTAPVVDKPFRFVVEKMDGSIIPFTSQKVKVTEETSSKIVWQAINTSEECDLVVSGQMEFDGFVDYSLRLIANKSLKIKDIRLEIPVRKEKAVYMMGLGHEGGKRAADWQWKWDITKNQDMLWLGAVNGGMRIKWKAENYVRPLINIYYSFGPLNMPSSWGNGGKGGVDVKQKGGDVVVNAYSGKREIEKGDLLNYDFELLITPLKLIDKDIKYNDRYFHGGGRNAASKIEMAQKAGANIINIHHAEDIYPFINYPYLDENVEELTNLVEKAHQEDLRMKFYYTTRELTKNLPEFWAFYGLNGEVIFPGPGNESRTEALHPDGPNEWLIKNLREKYIPAWYNEIKEGPFKGEIDLSVITTPDSRLNNFYVAGLNWMVDEMGIDGVYIDDSALDRFPLRRARKIIDASRPEGRMDLHSWNHFNEWAGYTNCLNLYMDLLPYFDLVWIGEGRDYDRLPDHWLIEVSGIPFGLAGQMLQGGGNPWRGMVYGITNRAGWTKWPPNNLWEFFDEYDFTQRDMIGYWDERCPVSTDNPDLVSTVFKGADDMVLAIGNWSQDNQTGNLRVDWNKMNISPDKAKLLKPGIPDFQDEAQVKLGELIEVEGGKGMILIIK